jgi:hypothetical protein
VTIDERLEALTETVGIIAAMQKDNERRFAETDRRMAETDRRLGQVLQAITQLGNIAESHDHRLDNLENRPH